ncbi:sugar phosphate isomerase/epimerase [bacterium]|nr:MAG: sugar phosphate isomerase/epimerase [bacterium]
MFSTRTGNFPIGIRRGWSEWQKSLPNLLNWANDSGFSVIDLGRDLEDLKTARQSGFTIGSFDLLEWHGLMNEDAGIRREAVEKNAAFVKEACAGGATNFFCVMLPPDPKRKRSENFADLAESVAALAPALEEAGGRLVIEGWPGPGALCCTPESYRALFTAVPSKSVGINYDPSHLLRMGIDPIRFLKEFADRVGHVHGKDCEILTDDLYEYGWEQPATWKENPNFGASAWRYTIPGQGLTNWGEVFRILDAQGYNGAVSIELEDKDYNISEEGEKAGFLTSAQFLASS